MGLEVGSGISNKKYDNREIYELINIFEFFSGINGEKEKYKSINFRNSLLNLFFFNLTLYQRNS